MDHMEDQISPPGGGIGNSNAILAPPSLVRHSQNHPCETPAGLARGTGRRLHPAPLPCEPVVSADERRAAGHEETCAVKISECIALSEVMNLCDRHHVLHFHPICPILELISRRPGGLPFVVVKN
jgi:hypothetical protein